jgi:hypothetical protein
MIFTSKTVNLPQLRATRFRSKHRSVGMLKDAASSDERRL